MNIASPSLLAATSESRHESAASKPAALAPGLYPVATPIGNLRDITLRALDVLAGADLLLCEDSRTTQRLMAAYGLRTPMQPYHEHNAAAARPGILARLAAGQAIALVSEGFKLLRDAIAAGHPVRPIPGACAPVVALSAAGLPPARALFAGFIPPKDAARRRFLAEFTAIDATLIFFESARRIAATLADAAALWPDRDAVLAREMTKLFEEFIRAPLPELAARTAAAPLKGEIVLLISPPQPGAARPPAAHVADMLRQALETASLRDAVAVVSLRTGLPRREIYALALAQQGGREGPDAPPPHSGSR